MNKLTIFEKKLPLRAYPDQELNKLLLVDFLPWIAKLLSLTDEVSAERLEVALPAIKEQCIGMGFHEIKKMFENYADGKMSLKPIPNYFDRILLGKIVSEYKLRNKPKVKEIEMQDKNINMNEVLTATYLEFKRTSKLPPMITHIYNYLHLEGKLPIHNSKFKAEILERAKVMAKTTVMERSQEDFSAHKTLGSVITEINEGKGLKSICQRIILMDYFNKQG